MSGIDSLYIFKIICGFTKQTLVYLLIIKKTHIFKLISKHIFSSQVILHDVPCDKYTFLWSMSMYIYGK